MNRDEAEEAEIDLSPGADDGLVGDQIREDTLQMSFDGEFTVAEDDEDGVSLTLAVDLNRMLRFYASSRTDAQLPNPGMKAGTSYFFTTVFDSSVMFFVGDIGSVEGYALTADAEGGVYAWMTIFRDADGSIIAGNVMPDDDNILTIMKGHLGTIAGGDDAGWDLELYISESSLTTFMTLDEVGDVGTCDLEISEDGHESWAGETVPVTYTRVL